MGQDWLFSSDEFICGVRTVGVLIYDHKILVQRDRDGHEFALPGGHVKIGETLEHGLIREYKEETGADVRCKRLLWSEESFWTWNGRQSHTLAFYYLIELCEGTVISEGEFVSHHDNNAVVFGWMTMDELQNAVIYPEFLKREVYSLSGHPKHFVSYG